MSFIYSSKDKLQGLAGTKDLAIFLHQSKKNMLEISV